EAGRWMPHQREGSHDEVHTLVALQSSQVHEQRLAGSRRGIRRVPLGVYPRIDDADALARDAAHGEVIGGALAYRLEWNAAVRTHERALQCRHDCGDRRGHSLEHRSAEGMRYQRDDTTRAPAGRV